MKTPRSNISKPTQGFSLIELLVVIGSVGVLAGILLPSMAGAKERAHVTVCLNNMRQMAMAVQSYSEDNHERLPSSYVRELNPTNSLPIGPGKKTLSALGGQDPQEPFSDKFPSARVRPLYPYLAPSRTYQCPRDKGQSILTCETSAKEVPSNYETVGCSYQYNDGLLVILRPGGFRFHNGGGLSDQYLSWVSNPSQFIMLHEPPARLYGCLEDGEDAYWYQWHFSKGQTEFKDPKAAPQDFWSPIAFVDGHVKLHDFSKSLATDPYYPYEATKDWTWYKALKWGSDAEL
ncbi:MAG: type II secretion system protein [Verrucomicrobiales bacterium]|nr:type II secretion system protein [Verrucomicrobiales bacterium]